MKKLKTISITIVLISAFMCLLCSCDAFTKTVEVTVTAETTVTVQTTATVTVQTTVYETDAFDGLEEPSGALLKVHFINVVQGDAIFIEFPDGSNMLIDAGDNPKAKTDMLLTYLNDVLDKDGNGELSDGEKIIDRIMVTHCDSDHIGGMDNVLDAYTVNKIYMPKLVPADETLSTAEQKAQLGTLNTVVFKTFYQKAVTEVASSGNSAEIVYNIGTFNIANADAGYDMTVICPSEDYYAQICQNSSALDKNNMSPIAILSYSGRKVCLTGDASYKQDSLLSAENNFLAYIAEHPEFDVDVDVLKVGHHGSEGSSGLDFLYAVKPEYAVFTNGDPDNGKSSEQTDDDISTGNTYGHPRPEVLSRLYKTGVKALMFADRHGDVKLTIGENGGMAFVTEHSAPYRY